VASKGETANCNISLKRLTERMSYRRVQLVSRYLLFILIV